MKGQQSRLHCYNQAMQGLPKYQNEPMLKQYGSGCNRWAIYFIVWLYYILFHMVNIIF